MTMIESSEVVALAGESDLILARSKARSYAKGLPLGLVDETKLVTAVSELARNILRYADRGKVIFEQVAADQRAGVRVTFDDKGPGIADISLAMTDGFSSKNGLGLGLPGSRRLVHDFEITSQPGEGTRIVITMWSSK